MIPSLTPPPLEKKGPIVVDRLTQKKVKRLIRSGPIAPIKPHPNENQNVDSFYITGPLLSVGTHATRSLARDPPTTTPLLPTYSFQPSTTNQFQSFSHHQPPKRDGQYSPYSPCSRRRRRRRLRSAASVTYQRRAGPSACCNRWDDGRG